MSETYTARRLGIVLASMVAVYVAYALGHALWAPLGAPAAGTVRLCVRIVTHRYWS